MAHFAYVQSAVFYVVKGRLDEALKLFEKHGLEEVPGSRGVINERGDISVYVKASDSKDQNPLFYELIEIQGLLPFYPYYPAQYIGFYKPYDVTRFIKQILQDEEEKKLGVSIMSGLYPQSYLVQIPEIFLHPIGIRSLQ